MSIRNLGWWLNNIVPLNRINVDLTDQHGNGVSDNNKKIHRIRLANQIIILEE
jgi:hypothetical protein